MAEPPGQEGEIVGYTVAYRREDAAFPVYLTGFLSAVFIAGWTASGYLTLLALGSACLFFAYYNFPLTETGRPRVGANQYGVFIEGLGLISWRSIRSIDLINIAIRADTLHEIHITPAQPLPRALIADWRQRPWWRRGMRLVWRLGQGDVVHLKVDALESAPHEIHHRLQKMWRFYRG